MTRESCQEFLDKLIDQPTADAAIIAHLDLCPACRAFRRTLDSLRRRESLFPPAPVHLAKAISEKILNLSPETAPSPAEPRRWGPLTTWALGLSFGLCLVLSLFLIHSERSMDVSPTSKPSLNQWEELTSGRKDVRLSDGSKLEITGPATFRPLARGFELKSGHILATVTPGTGTFTATTPHGKIEVLGTVFVASVSEKGTDVEVRSGKVRVTPLTGSPEVLVAGKTARMVSFGFPLLPGEPSREVSPSGEDPDQPGKR